jgi:hypothetical protein
MAEIGELSRRTASWVIASKRGLSPVSSTFKCLIASSRFVSLGGIGSDNTRLQSTHDRPDDVMELRIRVITLE